MNDHWSVKKMNGAGEFDRSSRPGSGRSDGGGLENSRMLHQVTCNLITWKFKNYKNK